jgi:hypothetical protein
LCFYQEDFKFDLGGDIVQVRDEVSPRNNFQLESLDGARFLSLSDYSVVDLFSPKLSGVVMGMSKEKKVTMLFSKRRCQQININLWDKTRETLVLAQSVVFTNARGNTCRGTQSAYVRYRHCKDSLGMTLGHYSLFTDTSYDIKTQVHDEIGNTVISLEGASRSVLYAMQSSSTFLDVKNTYRIPEVYDHTHFDEGTVMRGFATQFCVGVNYWSSVHTKKDFYYNTLSCLSADRNGKSIIFYFVFPSYGVVAPMHSGVVICFNPLIYHCCTDPVKAGVRIFSCYVSAKTCNTQIAFEHGNGK